MRVALVSAVLTGALAVAGVGGVTTRLPPDRPVPPGAPTAAPDGGFRWPVTGMPAVVRPFEAPAHRYGPGHRGVDLAAAPGSEVVAVADGTVAFAGAVAGRGVVSVDHANGLRSTYEPVTATVHTGQVVRTGAVLGVLQAGHRGCRAPACLHWGVRRGTEYLDPLQLLAPSRLRLKPWNGA